MGGRSPVFAGVPPKDRGALEGPWLISLHPPPRNGPQDEPRLAPSYRRDPLQRERAG